MILNISVIVLSVLISFFFGWFLHERKLRKILNIGTGKLGIIPKFSTYGDVKYVIEIEEIETAGELTKVRVIQVCSTKGDRDSAYKILAERQFNEWVLTKSIIWYDNNSQRIREEKLKQILKN